jgi:hypothetical protein
MIARSLPNLLVIGAPKCGTTTLHEMLSYHDQIYMSREKEPAYFSADHRYRRGIEWYADEFFCGADGYRWRGESTPWYLYSAEAAERVFHDLGPSIRLIVALRDPSSRALSMYWDQVKVGAERRPLDIALGHELMGHVPNKIENAYVAGGRYSMHIQEWLRWFQSNQFHLVVFERLIADPAREIGGLLRFLDLDSHDAELQLLPQRNVGGAARSLGIQRALLGIEALPQSLKSTVSRLLGSRRVMGTMRAIRRWNTREVHTRPSPSPDTLSALHQVYRSEVEALRQTLGVDLSRDWPDA